MKFLALLTNFRASENAAIVCLVLGFSIASGETGVCQPNHSLESPVPDFEFMAETNTLVKIVAASLVVVTNWQSIGTFIDKSNRQYDVLQGSLMTNTVGKMQAEGQTVEFVFKSTQGPTNEALRLVPIETQSPPVFSPPPLPINPRFVYPNGVVGTIPQWHTNRWLTNYPAYNPPAK